MAQKKKNPEIKIELELSYILEPYGTSQSNGCNWDDAKEVTRYKKAHGDVSVIKHICPYTRANFSCKLFTRKLEYGEIQQMIQNLNDDTKRFVELANQLIDLVMEKSKQVYPDLKKTAPLRIEDDWTSKFKFDKKNMLYRTNIFNAFNAKENPESKLLDVLQQMIDEGYEKYINFRMHFNCWGYMIDDKMWYDLTVQELIDHRRNQLKK